jgi:hypothetical protein
MSAFAGIKASAQGVTAPIIVVIPENVIWQAAPAYALGLVCTVSSGATLTYSVQVTADQIPSASGNWNNHDVLVNQTASANSNIAYPVTGLRLNVASYTNGSVNLGVAFWP